MGQVQLPDREAAKKQMLEVVQQLDEAKEQITEAKEHITDAEIGLKDSNEMKWQRVMDSANECVPRYHYRLSSLGEYLNVQVIKYALYIFNNHQTEFL